MDQDEISNVLSERAVAFSVEALLGLKEENSAQAATGFPEDNMKNENKNQLNGKEIKMELVESELWSQFHELQNEMIITKGGRRIFPTLKVLLSGLDPESNYMMWIDIVPVDALRYRYLFHSSRWIVSGTGDSFHSKSTYVHPDSPSTGKYWMSHAVTFDKLKLTNAKDPKSKGQISLFSMHKYQPRIHIQKVANGETDLYEKINFADSVTFAFPETRFFTVTAYQNQQITYLKIACNPFAKGFREVTRSSERKLGPDFVSNQKILDSILSPNEAELMNGQKWAHKSGYDTLNNSMSALRNKRPCNFSPASPPYIEQTLRTLGWTEEYLKSYREKNLLRIPYFFYPFPGGIHHELRLASHFNDWKEKNSWSSPSWSYWTNPVGNHRSTFELPMATKNFRHAPEDIVRIGSSQNNLQKHFPCDYRI